MSWIDIAAADDRHSLFGDLVIEVSSTCTVILILIIIEGDKPGNEILAPLSVVILCGSA